jgi:hypothetical protein
MKTPRIASSASRQTSKHLAFGWRQRSIHRTKAAESVGGRTQPRWKARLDRFDATICGPSRLVGSRR